VAVGGRSDRETGIEIVAAQDRSLQTKYHTTEILQTETETNVEYKKII